MPLSTRQSVHAVAPAVGRVEVMAFPTASTATQKELDGHEMPVRSGPLGLVLLST